MTINTRNNIILTGLSVAVVLLGLFLVSVILIFREAGLSYLQIGLMYAIRDVATNILEIPTGVFADAFGRRKSMLMAFGAYIISFLIFYAFTGFGLYALAMVLFAFGDPQTLLQFVTRSHGQALPMILTRFVPAFGVMLVPATEERIFKRMRGENP